MSLGISGFKKLLAPLGDQEKELGSRPKPRLWERASPFLNIDVKVLNKIVINQIPQCMKMFIHHDQVYSSQGCKDGLAD